MLTEAEAVVEQLDANSLKQLLLSFEKKITRNLKMRMKNSEEPEKFMESELELHADINELYAIAASPELYSTFVEAGSVNSVLGTSLSIAFLIFSVFLFVLVFSCRKYLTVYCLLTSSLLLFHPLYFLSFLRDISLFCC
jgi:ABC-type multidrug transport system permease subunit